MQYYFTRWEKIINFLYSKHLLRYMLPKFEFKDCGEYLQFDVHIQGGTHNFYIKKNGLKAYEIQAAYMETFYDYKVNGHAYIRREIPINRGDIVVDGGGCEGFFARYALEKGADKVIIFEPCSKLADGLEKTFQKDIEENKVILVRKALGSKKENKNLLINEEMYCASSLLYRDMKDQKKEEVYVDKLDNILKELEIERIDFIKMDIEGAEMEALIGAKNTINCAHPKMVIATYHEYMNSRKCVDIVNSICNEYKYKFCGYYTEQFPWRPYLTLFY